MKKKLILKKEVIASLDNSAMESLMGGRPAVPPAEPQTAITVVNRTTCSLATYIIGGCDYSVDICY